MVFHPICLVIHLFELKSLPGDPPYFENDLLRKGAVGAIAIRRCHGSWIHDQTPELSPCLLNENGMIIDYEENKDISKVRYQLDLIGDYLNS